MGSLVQKLSEHRVITPPKFLVSNIQYETLVGSTAYGTSSNVSDVDIYGFTIPPKTMIFPHLSGEIFGFGRQKKRFNQYQQHHIKWAQSLNNTNLDRIYDITIYSIVKYFQLLMENNPNMIDSIFTPQNCVLRCTKIGNMVRENRKMFLHKGAWFKFKGYAFSQCHKLKNKKPEGNRNEMVEKYGFDLKYAFHLVRLLNEIEQILIEHDLDLTRNREQLKSIRRGEWTEDQIIQYFTSKERELEKVYSESTLPHGPDEEKIKQLLLNCLEEHYGNLDNCITIETGKERIALRKIRDILDEGGYQ